MSSKRPFLRWRFHNILTSIGTYRTPASGSVRPSDHCTFLVIHVLKERIPELGNLVPPSLVPVSALAHMRLVTWSPHTPPKYYPQVAVGWRRWTPSLKYKADTATNHIANGASLCNNRPLRATSPETVRPFSHALTKLRRGSRRAEVLDHCD